jgi:hypothetical protein
MTATAWEALGPQRWIHRDADPGNADDARVSGAPPTGLWSPIDHNQMLVHAPRSCPCSSSRTPRAHRPRRVTLATHRFRRSSCC